MCSSRSLAPLVGAMFLLFGAADAARIPSRSGTIPYLSTVADGEKIVLFHHVFKMALIHVQLVSCRIAELFAAISARPCSACWVAASKESKTRFAK